MKNKLVDVFKRVFAVFLLSVLSYTFCMGQDTLVFTLNSAVELALSDNPTIKIANSEIQRMKYAKQQVIGGFIPSIDGSASYTRNIVVPSMFIPALGSGALKMGFDNSYNAAIQAGVPLYSESLIQNLNISKKDIEIALESARASRINMVSEVKNAYYTILLAKISYKVLKQTFDNAMENYINTKQMYNNGMASEYDMIRSEVMVRNINPSLLQAKEAVKNSKLLLAYLIGLPLETPIKVSGSLNDYEQDVTTFVTTDTIDIDVNSDLRQLELQKQKMELQYKLVTSQYMPTIVAFINGQVMTQNNTFKFGTYDWRGSLSAGMQLNIPIFRGLSTMRQRQQVQIGIDQMGYQYGYMKEGLSVSAMNAISSIKTAAEQLLSNKMSVQQAEKGYSIAETRYRTGVGTLLELNDAEMAVVNSNLNYNKAIYDFLKARTEYDKILGIEK